MTRPFLLPFVLLVAGTASAKPPACASWPKNMALVHLKNAGIIDPTKIDEKRTQVHLLAAEPLGHGVFREVYDLSFQDFSGKPVEVLTSSDASQEECSLGGVEVYVVSHKLGGP